MEGKWLEWIGPDGPAHETMMDVSAFLCVAYLSKKKEKKKETLDENSSPLVPHKFISSHSYGDLVGSTLLIQDFLPN